MKIKQDIIWRVGVLYAFAVLFAVVMLGDVIYLQVVEGEKYRQKEEALTDRDEIIEANRGNVLASDGRKLACSVPSYRIYMDLLAGGLTDEVFNNGVDSLALCLSKYFKDRSVSSYKKSLLKGRKNGRRYFMVNSRRISYTQLKKVKEFPLFRLGRNKGGFIPEQYDQRKQPFGMLASRTIGDLRGDKLKEGRLGIEKAYNQELKGVDGISTWQRVAGRWVPKEEVEPIDGKDVLTTIDIGIQDVADHALRSQLIKHNAHHGVAILMEVQTGAVKAMVNLHRKREGVYIEDHYNYAIGDATEPGFTFKLASMLVALEDGVVDLTDSVDTGKGVQRYYDRLMKDSHHGGYGKITVKEVFEKSSNVGISKIINNHYHTNPERYVNRLYAMGLNDKNGIDIMGEDDPMIKYPGESLWSGVTLPWMSIGYESEFTPLQMLTFYNAIANNGCMVRPMFVKGIMHHGEVEKIFEPHIINPSICSIETIEKAHLLLEGVVENGTAKNIKSSNYKIAGKTGTAQIAQGSGGYNNRGGGNIQYMASFAGYFPADEPLYSCIVMVYGPSNNVYYGNVVAGSVFREISDRVYATNYQMLPHDNSHDVNSGVLPYSKGGMKEELDAIFTTLRMDVVNEQNYHNWISTTAQEYNVLYSPKTFPKDMVPSVKGMGARDAISLLENYGLRVAISGRGKVLTQSIPAGRKCKAGDLIVIKLG